MDLSAFTAGLNQSLLQLASTHDSNVIKSVTETLNQTYFSKPQCIPSLTEISAKSEQWQVRQLAAVELRKRVTRFWEDLDENTQTQIKQQLLDIILREQQNLVRNSIARAISSAAKIEIPKGRWSDLVQFLYQCTTSSNAAHREVGVYVLLALFEVIADHLSQHLPQLFNLFATTLNDPESFAVRIITLEALGKVAEFIEPADKDVVRQYQDLIPSMIQVLQQAMSAGDEDHISKGIEVFDILLELEAPLLNKHLPAFIQFLIETSASAQLDSSIRVQTLSLLSFLPMYKRSKLLKLKAPAQIVTAIFPIAAEPEPEDIDEDSPARLALRVINSLGTYLPPQHVFPTCADLIVKAMNQPNPGLRKAALMSLAVLVEGCADFMRADIDGLLQFVRGGLADPEAIVRRAACVALCTLAEELSEEVTAQHSTILPALFPLLSDPSTDVQKQACNALDAFVEVLGDNIKLYIEPLMEKLLVLLETAVSEVRATVVAAIGSAAHASGESFSRYFPHVIPRLVTLMSLTNAEDHLLRGVATDTVATIADAVGPELFRPYVPTTMQLAHDGLQITGSRLRECSFCYFAVLARVFKSEFGQFLPQIIPHLINSCKTNESDMFGLKVSEEIELSPDDSFNSTDNDDEDDDDFNFSSAIAEEKETAVDSLGEIFEATKEQFLPYIDESLKTILDLAEHYSEGVRKAVVLALFRFLVTFWRVKGGVDFDSENPASTPALDGDVKQMNQLAMDAILRILEDEDDRTVVSQTLDELASSLKIMGSSIVETHFQPIANHLLSIFDKKHPCQQDGDADEDELEQSELAEYDSILISSASDVIGALALVLGTNFSNLAGGFLPHIIKYYKPTQSASERSMAIGCLGEVIAGMKGGITPFTQTLYPIITTALSDPEDEVRSNAAYSIGVLVANTELDMSSEYLKILTLLRPLFEKQKLLNVTDNASGAVCRMMMKNLNAVPTDQVLPVLINSLPLKKDHQENTPVYRLIISLFNSQNQVIFPYLSTLLPIFQTVIEKNEVTENLKKELTECVNKLSAESRFKDVFSQFGTSVAGSNGGSMR